MINYLFLIFFILLSSVLSAKESRFAHLLHIDGVRPDVFERMMNNGNLIYFQYLKERGLYSFKATTVDKSETMKVIPSYLTSKINTSIVGWWQFDKKDFKFHNFWIDPVEVLNYEMGFDFPLYPTINDLLTSKNEEVFAGFTLYRRGVPFKNYSRNFVAGLEGVYKHSYLAQAEGTIDDFLDLYIRNLSQGKPIARFSHLVLAAPDEFGHLEGITANDVLLGKNRKNPDFVKYCFNRNGKHANILDVVFLELDKKIIKKESRTVVLDKVLNGNYLQNVKGKGHFFDIKTNLFKTKVTSFCIDLPVMDFYTNPVDENAVNSLGHPSVHVVNPMYALAIIWMDIQFGKILNLFNTIKVTDGNPAYYLNSSSTKSLIDILNASPDSLLQHSLIAVTSDHGLVDTKWMIGRCEKECDKYGRNKDSINLKFIELLNQKLGLITKNKDEQTRKNELIGIDDTLQPKEIANPHELLMWQNVETTLVVQNAKEWSQLFFTDLMVLLKKEIGDKYWWLSFLRNYIVYPKLEQTVAPYKQSGIDVLTRVFLRGEGQYQIKEQQFLKQFYARHVRLIYGGAARNNAEIFIPHQLESGEYTWQERPTLDEIYNYKVRSDSEKSVFHTLLELESVGIVLVKEKFKDHTIVIHVFDRFLNYAKIKIFRDSVSRELVYGYYHQGNDPFALEYVAAGKWKYGTYQEWNDLSIDYDDYYHNPIAGIGSFMYSDNSALGDITIMHAQWWNYGVNAGGHGGFHKGEKRIVMLISTPESDKNRELFSKRKFNTVNTAAGVILLESEERSYPSILDITPSILDYLGYGPDALTNFSRSKAFPKYLQEWMTSQRQELIDGLPKSKDLQTLLESAGLQNMDISPLNSKLLRLLDFFPKELPILPDMDEEHQDGSVFIGISK